MERWQIIVELTTDIKEGENRHEALERVKKALEVIRGDGKELAHYHIVQPPKVCEDF